LRRSFADAIRHVPLLGVVIGTCVGIASAHGGSDAAVAISLEQSKATSFDLSRPILEARDATTEIRLFTVHGRRNLVLHLPIDGHLEADEAEAVEDFFRCRRTDRTHKIATGLLLILADLSEHYPEHTIEIVSGYRARSASRTSRHRSGHAVDLKVPGIPLRKVRDYLWRTLRGSGVGIGHYHEQGFVHVDFRPDDLDAAWRQRRMGARYQYQPYWSTLPDELPRDSLAWFDTAR